MSHAREERSASPPRASVSPPPRARRSRSLSRSRRSRSRSPDEPFDASNPGNNLYVTGLSTRVTSSDLEKYFAKEGKVTECHLVTDPRTRESRGFAFITMDSIEDAERCIKYLNRSVLEGRLITVEKAKRKRGRTPTPGRYQGLREQREKSGRGSGGGGGGGRRRRSRSYSPRRWNDREKDVHHSTRDRRGGGRSRSPPPYSSRRGNEYDSHSRRRDHSLSTADRSSSYRR